MDKRILAVLILSVIFLAAAFMGGDPASARGFYYVIWLAFIWLLWKKRGPLEIWLQSRTLPGFFLFVGLGLMMIIIEETIAGITVHLLSVKSLSELPALIIQYYASDILPTPKGGGFYRPHGCEGKPSSYCHSGSPLMSQRFLY